MRTDPEKFPPSGEAEAQTRSYNRHARRAAAATGKHPQDILDEDNGPQNPSADPDDCYLPASRVWRRYGVSSMSLHRWLKDPRLGFPRPTYIARRRYWRLSQLRRWEIDRAAGREVA